jgi:4-hydroxybenzoate polyprenyltransferase
MGKTVSLLQLIRLPNILTAVSNVWAGLVIAGGGLFIWQKVLLVSVASAGLYSGGIALNDYFDRQHDRKHHPQRPIPSGALSVRTTLITGILFLALGTACGFLLSPLAGAVAAGIAAAALLYDSVLKRWFVPAVVAMGLCRGLNWALGLAAGERLFSWLILLPAAVLLYIAFVTAVARYEMKRPSLKQLVKIFITAIPAIDGAVVLAFGYYWQAAAIALLVVPVIVLGKTFRMT